MAYPTGTGTEILYAGSIATQSTDATAFRWDKTDPTTGTETYVVPATHIITVLSIIWCEVGGNAETIGMYAVRPIGTVEMLNAQTIGEKATFVWNEKIVLVGGDKLITVATSGDIDIHYSFIDQDWS